MPPKGFGVEVPAPDPCNRGRLRGFPRMARLLYLCGAAWLGCLTLRAEEFEAVASTVGGGYARAKLPDGSFRPETYTFKEGGYLSGELADDTIDKITFKEVAQTLAEPLASQAYFPASDPGSGKLLIVVYWGTTRAPTEKASSTIIAQMTEQLGPPARMTDSSKGSAELMSKYGFQGKAANFGARMVDEEDARLLGYPSALDPDLRHYRYFVVLLAYDLQQLVRDKKPTLLWQTRFSIDEHRNQFDRELHLMAVVASRYFGRDSLGLRRDPVPEGRVEVGEVRSLGTVEVPDYPVLAPDGSHVAYFRTIKSELELAIVDIDRPDRLAFGRVPHPAPLPTQLSWADSSHVQVTLSSTESLRYDLAGRRSGTGPREAAATAQIPPGRPANPPPGAEVQALADSKFPHRKVALLGSDDARHRFLLVVSGGAGPSRFFVLDRQNDLLYEVGRSENPR